MQIHDMGDGLLVQLTSGDIRKLKVGHDKLSDICATNKDPYLHEVLLFLGYLLHETGEINENIS